VGCLCVFFVLWMYFGETVKGSAVWCVQYSFVVCLGV